LYISGDDGEEQGRKGSIGCNRELVEGAHGGSELRNGELHAGR